MILTVQARDCVSLGSDKASIKSFTQDIGPVCTAEYNYFTLQAALCPGDCIHSAERHHSSDSCLSLNS